MTGHPPGTDRIGRVTLVQGRGGAKASVDGLLLARFLRPQPQWRVADLGCGNGLVGLTMAADEPRCTVVGVEVQPSLARQARDGARLSTLPNFSVVLADLRNPPWPDRLGRFDLVAANPPYRRVGSGRTSPDPVRATARHELMGDVFDFARAAASLLRDGATVTWVFPSQRRADLGKALEGAGLEPVRFRQVLSRAGEEPVLVLVEAVLGGGVGTSWEEEPLILYQGGEGRDYTPEARDVLYGEA